MTSKKHDRALCHHAIAGDAAEVTMAIAITDARARLARAERIVEGSEEMPDPSEKETIAKSRYNLTTWFGSRIAAALVIRGDREPAFMERLKEAIDMRLARWWWNEATTNRPNGQHDMESLENEIGRDLDPESIIVGMARTTMDDCVTTVVLRGVTMERTLPFCVSFGHDMTPEDPRTAGEIAARPAIAGPCRIMLMPTRTMIATSDPTWAELIEAITRKHAEKTPDERYIYFEGISPADGRAKRRRTTHIAFMGS